MAISYLKRAHTNGINLEFVVVVLSAMASSSAGEFFQLGLRKRLYWALYLNCQDVEMRVSSHSMLLLNSGSQVQKLNDLSMRASYINSVSNERYPSQQTWNPAWALFVMRWNGTGTPNSHTITLTLPYVGWSRETSQEDALVERFRNNVYMRVNKLILSPLLLSSGWCRTRRTT